VSELVLLSSTGIYSTDFTRPAPNPNRDINSSSGIFTDASVPYIGNLYTKRESGGYFIPQMLGVTNYLGRGRTHVLDTLDTISTNEQVRGLTRVFQNKDLYTSDFGLTNDDQLTPVSAIDIDARWMKASVTEWIKAGTIINAREVQDFSPYQTKYETVGNNLNGIRRQGDKYDPWHETYDDQWENSEDWPPNFRKQYNIEDWYKQFDMGDRQVYQWKTDIFGNEFALLKNNRAASIYTKKHNLGEIWTRDARNIIQPASASLVNVYNKFTHIDIGTNIYDIDVWYDTLMIWTPSAIAITKLNFDYEDNTIFALADNSHEIFLCDSKLSSLSE